MYTLWIVTSDTVDIYLCALQMLSCMVDFASIKHEEHKAVKTVMVINKHTASIYIPIAEILKLNLSLAFKIVFSTLVH